MNKLRRSGIFLQFMMYHLNKCDSNQCIINQGSQTSLQLLTILCFKNSMPLNTNQIKLWLKISVAVCWYAAILSALSFIDSIVMDRKEGIDILAVFIAIACILTAINLIKLKRYALYAALLIIVFVIVSAILVIYLVIIFPATNGVINKPDIFVYLMTVQLLIGCSCFWMLVKKEVREYVSK